MFAKFDAELWTFDPSVDPPSMRKYDQFGHWIFVYRNPHKDKINKAWFNINKETLAIDPGGNIFETIYNKGTGDVFYVGEGLGSDIRHHLRHLSWMQKDRDNRVNSMDSVNGKKEESVRKSKALYDKVSCL
jgi:transposase